MYYISTFCDCTLNFIALHMLVSPPTHCTPSHTPGLSVPYPELCACRGCGQRRRHLPVAVAAVAAAAWCLALD